MAPYHPPSIGFLTVVLSLFLPFVVSTTQEPPSDCKLVVAGAGIGGAYVAYRFLESGHYSGKDICILEARKRPGGRILTVRGAVRGFDDYVVDLGAYRYKRPLHMLVYSVAERLLKLSFMCYKDPFPKGFPGCTEETVDTKIYSTRARVLTPATNVLQSYNKNKIPFSIPPQFRWGPNTARSAPRSPFDILLSWTSLIQPIAAQWDTLQRTKNYTHAMEVADDLIRQLKYATYQGVPVTEVSHWQFAIAEGMTNEELTLFLEREGPSVADLLHVSVYNNAVYCIRNVALEKFPISGPRELVTPAAVRHGVTRRIGMQALVNGLLRAVKHRGVRVYYNHRVTHISRRKVDGEGIMRVNVNNNFNIRTGNLFLNMPKDEVLALGMSSEPLKSGSRVFLKMLDRITAITLSKMYCFWDDAWWISKLNYTRGTYLLGDETIYTGRYHDGDVTCQSKSGRGDGIKCRGALLVSYIGGSFAALAKAGITLHAYNKRKYRPWRWDVSGNARVVYNGDGHDGMLFKEVHRQLRRTHFKAFRQAGLSVYKDLPDARGCVYADWMDSGMHYEIGPNQPKTNPFKAFSRPVKGLNLSLVNEGWSDFTGWSEGSLRSAERALYHVHGVRKPDWLDDAYHKSVIRKYNRG